MGRKVLVLETDEQLRTLIVPLLEAREFEVSQETSGQLALEKISESAPDLVMVGESLDDIDGIGFIIKLRQTEKDLKVVFLSQSWRDAEFFQKVTKELKVDHIFHRPIKSSVFGVQVDALWHDQKRGLPHIEAQKEPVPQPMGNVPQPVPAVPGTGNTPWPAPGAPQNYNFPGLQNQGGTAGGAPVPEEMRQSGQFQRPAVMVPGPGGPGPNRQTGQHQMPPGGPRPPMNRQTGSFQMPPGGAPPMPGQPMPGQPMPGQPMPGQPMPGQAMGPPNRQTGNFQMPVPGGPPMPGQPMPGQIFQGQQIQYLGGPLAVPGAPPMPTPQSVNAFADATLQNFRQRFSKSLPNRIKQIEELIQQVDRANIDGALLIEIRRLSHNLKGTSKSCGFDSLGGHAEQIECSARDMMEIADVNHEREWLNIDHSLLAAKKEVDIVKMQFSDYVPTAEEMANLNPNAAKAKVLVVGSDLDVFTQVEKSNGVGIPLEIIRVEATVALERAGKQELDAALIEITEDNRDSAFQLARELRSMIGYETLPLGFIAKNDEGDRAEAAHAGASLFLEKPFETDTLQQALQHLITIREGGRSRVLIVDDDPDFTDLISSTLGNEGMLVKAVNDPANVLDILEEFTPDLMLLDVMMPGILGFDVCKKVRAAGRWQELPIIFLTAQTDLASRLSAFDSGGDDYLPKPVINVELLRRVKVRLERARMSRERQDRDLLTGLLLRRAFADHIEALVSESERHNFNFSLCLMDIDHFKKVNDNYGHMAGDRVLAYFGKLLRKRFRVEDLRGRWGGEEFILAFRHERKDTMQGALNRVLEELKKVEFKGDKGEPFFTSFSAGMVDFPEDGTSLNDLVLNADRRLYLAKHNGRSQIVITG